LGFAARAFADDERLLIAVLVALPLSLLITRYRWLSVPVDARNALHGAEPSVDYSAGALFGLKIQ